MPFNGPNAIYNGDARRLPTSDVCLRCLSEGRVAHSEVDSRFLSTSYFPNELELEDMKAAVEMEEILVQKIETLRRSLKARIQQRRSAISLLRRIPVEIWEIIFSFVCHGNSSYSFDTRHAGQPPAQSMMITPNILGSVCAHWQHMVHKMPRLWTSIRFDTSHFILLRSPLPPLRTHLLRSNECPLDLYLSFRDEGFSGPRKPNRYKDEVLAVALPHIWRCRSFTLSLDRGEPLGDLLSRSNPPSHLWFPYLQKLSVHSDSAREAQQWFWGPISQATSLTHVSTTSLTNLHSIPYRQLTSLSVDGPLGTRGLGPVLAACSSLQSLSLADFRPQMGWAGPISVVLPSLSELSLAVRVFPDDILPLLTMATFPILRKLSIVCSEHSNSDRQAILSDPDRWSPNLSPSLRRSTTKLDHLSLTFHDVSIRNGFRLAGILEATPNVSRLEMDFSVHWENEDSYHFVSYSLLGDLRVYPDCEDNAVLLPRLTYLGINDSSLRRCHHGHVDFIIRCVAESRSMRSLVGNGVVPLEDLHFTYCDGSHGKGEVVCNDVAQDPVILDKVKELAVVHGIRSTLAHAPLDPSAACTLLEGLGGTLS